MADLPSATTPPAHAAPGCTSRTGRESTDGARLADPRTATSRDGCASTRDGPATTSTPQSSGRPADELEESTTASREKRRRRSRWDAPGDGLGAVARGPSDRPDAVAVVPTRGRETGALSRPRRDEGTNQRTGQSHTSETGLLDESFKSFKSETLLPPAGVLTLPGGVVAKLPASFLCERDAPTNADAATYALFAKLARVNRAEIFGGEWLEDEGFEDGDCVKDGERRRERKRSVSPEPVYGPDGARVNTREKRAMEKLAAKRAECLRAIKKLCPSFTFPESYVTPPVTRKIFIPLAKHPGYNFFGLIIGPRGNTQKQMQRDFGVRIVIRGRGSEKKASLGATETGDRVAGRHDPTEEPMHVLVTGDDEASVDAAAAAVGRLLEPLRDEENEHKRAQLRELAVLNGTLRERHDDGVKPGSADDDGVGVVAGSLLPPELRARVAAQYEKDARATQKLADDETLGGDHDAAYRAFLAEVGVAPRAREGLKNAGGETRDDETLDDASAVDKRKAYVGRLPPFAAEHTVRLTFQPFGAIEKVEVVPDREKNLPCRGFAFVQFREEAAARAAATYFSTRAAAFPHPPPPGFAREPFRAMDVRVKADPRPQTAAVRVAQTTPVTSHDPRCRLYVAKLPHTFSSAELRSLVAASLAGSTAGSTAEFEDGDATGEESIVSCDVVVDKITGLSRGFAFVRMRDARVAARVVAALDGVHVENRGLVVRVAAEKNRRTPTSDPSNAPSGYPTGGGFVTPLSGDPYVNAGVYDPHGNPFVYYDPRAVAAAEAAVAAANPALAAAAAAEMAAIATGAGPGPGPAAFFSGAHGHMSPGIFPAAAATIAPGDPVEAPPPPPP